MPQSALDLGVGLVSWRVGSQDTASYSEDGCGINQDLQLPRPLE